MDACTFQPQTRSHLNAEDALNRSDYTGAIGKHKPKFADLEQLRVDALEANITATPKIAEGTKKFFAHITRDE
jgi:hypothetical protein